MSIYIRNLEHSVVIPSGKERLNGFLYISAEAKGIVLFAHGRGSSRFSVRNQYVAHALNAANHGTLLFDLLTPEDEVTDIQTREFRFNINLLVTRLMDASIWCKKELASEHLTIGFFGSSTGGGAALVAAAEKPDLIKAVVSRGGRPDLAGKHLPKVKAPSLLIVGSKDETVIELNKDAMSHMACKKQLEIVHGASHLFEEPGTLEEVSNLAIQWFDDYLS